jgi:HEAT repeat protein
MTTRLFKLLLAVLLCAQTPLILSAQTTEGADDYSASIAGCNAFKAKSLDRGKSSTDFLRAHGIEISEPSLIAALQSALPEVRFSAVTQLLADCDLQSIPVIEKTLYTERDEQIRAGTAGGLASFGDPVGAKYLAAACTDNSLSTLAMSAAVEGLQQGHYLHPQFPSPSVCADTVLNLFDSRPDSKVDMVELFLAMSPDVSPTQADRMVADAQSLLQSDDASHRMAGSEVLAELNSTASIELIHKAMERATDSSERSFHYSEYCSLLPAAIKAMPQDQAASRIAEVEGLLQDKDPSVRWDSARALAKIGSLSSIEALRAAIQRETDPSTIEELQSYLDKLTNPQQQSAPAASANPPH